MRIGLNVISGSVVVSGGAVIAAVSPVPSAWIEKLYSLNVYPILQNIITPLSGLFPFALLDVLLIGATIGFSVWSWVQVKKRAQRGEPLLLSLGRQTLISCGLVAVGYLCFLGLWGLNYRREPMVLRLDYQPSAISHPALIDLANTAVSELNQLYVFADESSWPSLEGLPSSLGESFAGVQKRLGAEKLAVPGIPKRTLLASYFRWAGIDGMMNPFFLEVLINPSILPYERPFVVAHEWAHLGGYANEAEANFVGWLICLTGDVQARYSGWLFLTRHLLIRGSTEVRALIWDGLNEGPLRHFQAISDRVSDSNPIVSLSARRVYDRFLRINRVSGGIASYGQVIDLVLGTRSEGLWRPFVTERD